MVSSLSLQVAASLLSSTASSGGGFDFTKLYSTGASATSSMPPKVALQNAETNEAKQIAQVQKDPVVASELARYAKVLASAKTINDVLDDPIARKVLLKANGLGDQVDAVGLAKKALASDPNDDSSVAQKMSSINSAWLEMVKKYDFANEGLDRLRPNNVGFTGDWTLNIQRDGQPIATDLVITNSTKTGYQATVAGQPAPITVADGVVTITYLYEDSSENLHSTRITGKIGSDGSLTGAQTDDVEAVGNWTATAKYGSAIKDVSDDYVAEKRLDMLDQQMPGLGTAILFKQAAAKSPTQFNSSLKILGSALGREVVTTALGLPKQLAIQSVEAQQKAIDQRLDPAKLSNPDFVDSLIQRYLIQLNGGTGGVTA
jgi:hypothetical protein